MSVNSYTEWGNLKEIIVGSVVNNHRKNIDLSFKLFYHDNLKHKVIQNSIGLQKKLIEERHEDLENLCSWFQRNNINVRRPLECTDVKPIKTPVFESFTRPMDNPRDLILIAGNEIIETPVLNSARYFETDFLKPLLMEYFKKGAKWTCAPRPTLARDTFDFSYVDRDLSSQKYERPAVEDREKFEIMFDAAQCLKFGKDIIMNVANENHNLGFMWLKEHLRDKFNLHKVSITDHHIDGKMMPLRPGKLLLSHDMNEHLLAQLPKELQKWDHIICKQMEETNYEDQVCLASDKISINVLPISEETVLVFSPTGEPPKKLVQELEKNKFNVETVQLRHSKIFDGGLHCCTLDTIREDNLESYF